MGASWGLLHKAPRRGEGRPARNTKRGSFGLLASSQGSGFDPARLFADIPVLEFKRSGQARSDRFETPKVGFFAKGRKARTNSSSNYEVGTRKFGFSTKRCRGRADCSSKYMSSGGQTSVSPQKGTGDAPIYHQTSILLFCVQRVWVLQHMISPWRPSAEGTATALTSSPGGGGTEKQESETKANRDASHVRTRDFSISGGKFLECQWNCRPLY